MLKKKSRNEDVKQEPSYEEREREQITLRKGTTFVCPFVSKLSQKKKISTEFIGKQHSTLVRNNARDFIRATDDQDISLQKGKSFFLFFFSGHATFFSNELHVFWIFLFFSIQKGREEENPRSARAQFCVCAAGKRHRR